MVSYYLPTDLQSIDYIGLVRSWLECTSAVSTQLNKLDTTQRICARVLCHIICLVIYTLLPWFIFLADNKLVLYFLKLQSLSSRREEYFHKLMDFSINIKVHPALFDMFLIDDVVISINKDNACTLLRKHCFIVFAKKLAYRRFWKSVTAFLCLCFTCSWCVLASSADAWVFQFVYAWFL